MMVIETQIDTLAERLTAVRETVWEAEPELLMQHILRAHDDKLFGDVNFGQELLLAAVAREIPQP